MREINLGYVDHVRDLNQAGDRSASPDPSPTSRSLRLRFGLWRRSFVANTWQPFIRTGGLVTLALALEVWLRLALFVKRSRPSQFTSRALECVDEFVEQYPFHMYPTVCKAFELAILGDQIPDLLKQHSSFVEIAIGEGTLSSRVFPPDATVVGLDLSPYSLKKASGKSHVKQAVVCDCLAPPIREGSFDVLISNNFLHHVTQKEQTLSRWSRVSEKAVFNENSPTWASGWTVPYVLKKLGKRDQAARAATRIEEHSLQSLEPKARLDAHVTNSYEILESVSYMSERTFFYCGLFSFIMRCYGPPTPPDLKRLFLGRLRWLALPLSADVAKLLIRYDQHQDRSTDSFISYLCKSRNYSPARDGNYLACPDCQGALTQANACAACGKEYSYTDGMLFLLPQELADLQRGYSHEVASRIQGEHL